MVMLKSVVCDIDCGCLFVKRNARKKEKREKLPNGRSDHASLSFKHLTSLLIKKKRNA